MGAVARNPACKLLAVGGQQALQLREIGLEHDPPRYESVPLEIEALVVELDLPLGPLERHTVLCEQHGTRNGDPRLEGHGAIDDPHGGVVTPLLREIGHHAANHVLAVGTVQLESTSRPLLNEKEEGLASELLAQGAHIHSFLLETFDVSLL